MQTRKLIWLSACLLSLALARPNLGAESDPQVAQDEKTLRDAKVPTDGAGLVAFFRQRTLSEADRAKLAATVRLLGDESFAVREKASRDLVLAGRLALPALRGAVHDPDLEIARRAERCLQEIEQGADLTLTAAAVRVLAARRPAGAAEVLLAYLPSADEGLVEDAVLAALAAVGLSEGKADPALVAALMDKDPARRAAGRLRPRQVRSRTPPRPE